MPERHWADRQWIGLVIMAACLAVIVAAIIVLAVGAE